MNTRTALQHPLVRGLLLILGVSVFVGGFLFHVWVGLGHVVERWPDLLINIYFSAVYTTIMFGSLSGASHWLQTHVPLRSRRAVGVHAGGLALTTAASYTAATALCSALHPDLFVTDWRTLLVTGTLAVLVTLVWSAFSYLQAFYKQLREAEAERYEARLQALRAQINPHFLFNAFNSIAALIRTRPDEAETVVEDLSDLFRYTLQASKNDVTPLGKELTAVQRYLAVEKARFRDRLVVEVDVPEALRRVSIPSMTLQPLVENAVKHGAGQTQDLCTVTIAAQRTNDTLVLRVTDTGPGFDTETLESALEKGSGLANVRERLQLFFGDAARMELLSHGIELRLPLQTETAEHPTAAGPPSPVE